MKALDWRSLISIASRASEEEKRRLLLDGIYRVVENWQGPLPDLLEIFRPEKIECLLSYAVTDQEGVEEARMRFIKFVVDTGYKDQPKVGTDGQYVLHRTTPIHLVLRTKIDNWDATGIKMVQLLFEIYDRFDLNYTDEAGFTHFQAACFIPYGHQLVRKFLQNGQNPNFFVNGYSLLRSALQNDTKWAMELLGRGADPTWVDTDGSTALHTICRDGHVELLQSFFEVVDYHRKPVQINVRDSLGNTPLHLAVLSGNVTTFELLLTRGADVNSVNEEGSTPLHLICRKIQADHLLEKFFTINARLGNLVPINARDKWQNTPLHLTLKNSNMWASEILLKRDADVNSVNEEGSTPLHLICQRAHGYNLLEILFKIANNIGKPVWINVPDKEGNTPLHLALSHRSTKKSEILMVNGANPNLADKNGYTALHLISNTRPHTVMKQFFEIVDKKQQTVQIDARDNKGWTPLHMALHSDRKEKFQMLLRRGADPNVTNEDGQTALHFICQRNSDDFMWHFFRIIDDMQQPVEIDARDNKGWTPLHMALHSGSRRKFQMLVSRGADPNVTYQDGQTPLSLALCNANTKMAENLLWADANPNLADKEGWTPLHIICIKCNWFLEKFFRINAERQKPVEINAKTKEGRTPLKLLRDIMPMNYEEASRYLELKGAQLD